MANVLEKNKKLKIVSKVSTLALKLARESFFSPTVMAQSTPSGGRNVACLPPEELYQLKTVVFQLFLRFWRAPQDYELLWDDCMTSIEQGCKRLPVTKITVGTCSYMYNAIIMITCTCTYIYTT